MRSRSGRRSPPAAIWIFACILVAAIVALAFLVQLTWQRTTQVQALQAEIQSLQSERQATHAQLVALQSTATAVESRLATLEANDPGQQLAALEAAIASTDDSQQLAALGVTLDEIQARVSTFQATLDGLASRIQALEPTDGETQAPLPPEMHLTVARQKQSHNLSCESSAASMVAQYHGVPLSEADVLNSLPSNANPNLGFRGNIDGPTGGIEDYGVYAGPILAILNARGLQAWRVQGGLDGIRSAIARGNPVIAWVTYKCTISTPTTMAIDGKEVTLVPYQHVVVVTGYDGGGVWANDPWDGQEDYYTNADLERAMGYFDDMAIEVAGP
jgi:uncharacterized protein YvpB/outer membrane murein-binding lipoprotein Lpp